VDGREMGNYYRERRDGWGCWLQLLVASYGEREACACSPKGVNEVVKGKFTRERKRESVWVRE
jgi:hypothetical protein